MPLTARHVDGRRIDSTNDDQWEEVYHAGYDGLFCPECRGPMHARRGSEVPRKIRCFAHNPGSSETCSLRNGESEGHRRTKVLIARAVRDLTGWTAEIEYPGDGWRADVLATSPSGDRQIAFEPQFSYIHPDSAQERTRRHAASGVETAWLAQKMGDDSGALPVVRLHYDDDRGARVSLRALGPAAYRGGTAPPIWDRRVVALDKFVRDVCLGAVTYDDGYWAAVSDRADFARLTRAAWEARKAREAAQQAETERIHAARAAARERAEEAKRVRDVEWERDRPRREAERAEAEKREQETRAQRAADAERIRVEQEAWVRRKRAEREAEQEGRRKREEANPWYMRPDISNEELLALARCFVEADKPFPGWLGVGDRLHSALASRELLRE